MIRLVALVLMWCSAAVLLFWAASAYAGTVRKPPAVILRACPEVLLAGVDPRLCPTGYDEGAACIDEHGMIDPLCSVDDEVRPTHDEVCAELVMRCA